MKKLVTICAVAMMVLAVSSVANATNITDAIKIDRVGSSDTFTVSFLYNSYVGDEENPFQWEYYDLMISAEPIIWRDPLPGEIIERALTPGEILVGAGNGYLYMGGYDWSSSTAPYQAVQITASNDTYSGLGTWATNTPLFSFTYTGSSTEFVIYNSIISQEIEAGRIAVPAIPEPATMALLGLGGLLLRRRK